MKKKSKSEYLRIKKLKQDAKKKESEHKIDYTENPTRDNMVPHHSNPYHGIDPLTMLYLLKSGMRRKR